MAVTRVYLRPYHFELLSTDTKPTSGVDRGERAYETDTAREFAWDGSAWVPSMGRFASALTHADIELARRQAYTGARSFFFFGHNDDIGTSWEDVHAAGGDRAWLTTATKIEVVSSHAADTADGLGLRSVEVHGLSANGTDQDEVIAMDGTDAVESELLYVRINKFHSETVGTYGGSHRGNVTCQVTGAGATLAVMTGQEGNAGDSVQYGSGEAGIGGWSVPLGKVLYIRRIVFIPNVKASQTIDIVLYEREGILTTSAPQVPRRELWAAREVNTEIDETFDSHIKIKALTDLWFRGKGSGSSNIIEVKLDFYLFDDNAVGA